MSGTEPAYGATRVLEAAEGLHHKMVLSSYASATRCTAAVDDDLDLCRARYQAPTALRNCYALSGTDTLLLLLLLVRLVLITWGVLEWDRADEAAGGRGGGGGADTEAPPRTCRPPKGPDPPLSRRISLLSLSLVSRGLAVCLSA
eukprot:3937198-Rhodomonas_salina.1